MGFDYFYPECWEWGRKPYAGSKEAQAIVGGSCCLLSQECDESFKNLFMVFLNIVLEKGRCWSPYIHWYAVLFELPRTDFSKTALLLLTAGRASLRWMDCQISGAENAAGKPLSAILQKSKPSPWEMEIAAGVGGFPQCLFSGWCLRNAASMCFFQGNNNKSVSLLAGQVVKADVRWVFSEGGKK